MHGRGQAAHPEDDALAQPQGDTAALQRGGEAAGRRGASGHHRRPRGALRRTGSSSWSSWRKRSARPVVDNGWRTNFPNTHDLDVLVPAADAAARRRRDPAARSERPVGQPELVLRPVQDLPPDHQAGREGHHDLDAGRVPQVQLPGLPALHAGRPRDRRRRGGVAARPHRGGEARDHEPSARPRSPSAPRPSRRCTAT